MLSFLFAGVLALLLAVQAPANLPRAAAEDVDSILEASAIAMEAVQSLRFSGTGEMSFGTGPTGSSMTMEVSGAYRAPDRLQISISMDTRADGGWGASMGNGAVEMVVIGDQIWGRMGSQDWETSSLGEMMGGFDATMVTPAMFSPSTFTRPDTNFDGLLPGATVSDDGGVYRISANADLADVVGRMVPEELGGPMMMADLFSGPARVQLSLDISRTTLYVERIQVTVSLFPEMMISFTGNMSDFDSPSVSIEPPM